MSRDSKIIVGVVAAVLLLGALLCACACIVLIPLRSNARYQSFEIKGPAQAVRVDDGLTDYVVPEGFTRGSEGEFMGFRWVELRPDGTDGHIMLFGLPRGIEINRETLERVAIDATDWGREDGFSNTRATGTREVAIRGQTVTLIEGQGTNRDDVTYRTLTGFFEGRTGPAMIMIAMPVGEWNEAVVQSFLDSID